MKKVLALLLVAGLLPLTAVAQQAPYGVVTVLEGQAINIAVANATPVPLKDKDAVSVGNRIETKEQSLVKMILGGKAVVTVREQSALTITEVAGMATINLASGKVAILTSAKRLRPGESIEVRTPNAIASVRGSLGIVEHIPNGNISHVDNGEGNVLGAPSGGILLPIPPLQGLTITGNTVGGLRAIRPDATRGLISKRKPGPGQKHTPSQSELASDLAALGGGSGTAMPGTTSPFESGGRVLPGNPKSGVYVP